MKFLASNIQIVINPNLPGTTSSTTPGGWVASFYQFALLMAGILAFGAIVYGGFLYATAQGNPGREGEGKSWISGALIGLLLLAGAYVILFTVNPNILSLSLPGLPDVTAPTAPPVPASGDAGGGAGSTAPCATDATCGNPSYCTGSCPSKDQTCTRANGTSPYACVTNAASGFCDDTHPNGQCLRPGTKCQNVAGHNACVVTNPTKGQCNSDNKNTCKYVGINANPPLPGCRGEGVEDGGDASCNKAPSSPISCYNVIVCP